MAKKPVTPPAHPTPAGTLHVKIGYRGKATRERYIAPGDYADNDPALFGLAEFLILSGRAEWLPRPPKSEGESS